MAAVYLMMCCVLVAVRAGHRRGRPCRVLRGHVVVSRSRIQGLPQARTGWMPKLGWSMWRSVELQWLNG